MFSRNRPDRDDRACLAPTWGWRGRGGRIEFGVVLLALLALKSVFHGGHVAGDTVLTLLSIRFSIRRLHDFGRSGWWVAIVPGVVFAVALTGVIAHIPKAVLGPVITMAALAMYVGFAAFLGLMPGDDGPNRFGAPQTRRRRPTARSGADLPIRT
jgi:hypothetical protein